MNKGACGKELKSATAMQLEAMGLFIKSLIIRSAILFQLDSTPSSNYLKFIISLNSVPLPTSSPTGLHEFTAAWRQEIEQHYWFLQKQCCQETAFIGSSKGSAARKLRILVPSKAGLLENCLYLFLQR